MRLPILGTGKIENDPQSVKEGLRPRTLAMPRNSTEGSVLYDLLKKLSRWEVMDCDNGTQTALPQAHPRPARAHFPLSNPMRLRALTFSFAAALTASVLVTACTSDQT